MTKSLRLTLLLGGFFLASLLYAQFENAEVLGTVRDLTDGKVTVALDYEAYPAMAEKKMAEIEADTRARWPVGDIAMIHRLGRLDVGEVSVAVAVSCPHRADAFAACRHAIDRLKELVPIWKRENWADGQTEWVDPIRSAEPGARSEKT